MTLRSKKSMEELKQNLGVKFVSDVVRPRMVKMVWTCGVIA